MRKQHPEHLEAPFHRIEIIRKKEGWGERFLHTSLCLLIAVAACALNGCTAAVPYAISAAQIVTTGGSLTQPGGPMAQPDGASVASANAAASKARQEEALPYQLIAEKNTMKPCRYCATELTNTTRKLKASWPSCILKEKVFRRITARRLNGCGNPRKVDMPLLNICWPGSITWG